MNTSPVASAPDPAGAARPAHDAGCPLCRDDGGEPVWRDGRLRVVLADEPEFPGFTRVIWHAHVAENTDLAPPDRDRLVEVVWTVERTMRDALAPAKVNVASLGNVVPHLHWHVVPRWPDDPRFPASPWSPPREGHDAAAARARRDATVARLPAYRDALARALAALPPG